MSGVSGGLGVGLIIGIFRVMEPTPFRLLREGGSCV